MTVREGYEPGCCDSIYISIVKEWNEKAQGQGIVPSQKAEKSVFLSTGQGEAWVVSGHCGAL